MEDEDNVAEYYNTSSISEPSANPSSTSAVYPGSRTNFNELFWQGFHPDDRAMLLRYLGGSHSIQQPGADFNFQERFDQVHAIFSQWRLEDEGAEAEAAQRWREEDRELEQLIKGTWDRSSGDDPTYALAHLYRQCARRFPNALRGVPKPKPSPELAQDTPPQKTSHIRQALPVHSSPARNSLATRTRDADVAHETHC